MPKWNQQTDIVFRIIKTKTAIENVQCTLCTVKVAPQMPNDSYLLINKRMKRRQPTSNLTMAKLFVWLCFPVWKKEFSVLDLRNVFTVCVCVWVDAEGNRIRKFFQLTKYRSSCCQSRIDNVYGDKKIIYMWNSFMNICPPPMCLSTKSD